MAGLKIRLDHGGMAEMLGSPEVAAEILAKASEVQGIAEWHQSVARHRMPVERESYETDRAAEAVTIAHAGGKGVEAKYGALAEAARAAGLEVTAEPPTDVRRRPRKRRRRRE